ncbi:hypothetical protein Q5424_01300 [Conexibacter sp. JD483]|uniref:hypothetical protein n=1 Tax=unclassified Conexibacter TaxID=2627773 RepID=UPI00271D8F1F|nr:MULTISPECIES: hypothetical protein [unclassified Conexibacter]MDO8185866.1 hypothetical protein [Conexibacter sp. CPCC 205706]MDO8198609.1 hypothetical protein [Conexibacter sp. CPCC 205762]MDR9367695.1 hypothetical protein [Conexibacter sp. JD483]
METSAPRPGAVSRPSMETLRNHLALIAVARGITIAYDTAPIPPERLCRAHPARRVLITPRVRRRREYFIALHGLAMLIVEDTRLKIVDEPTCWLWAIENAKTPLTPSIATMIDNSVFGAVLDAGYSSFAAAAAALGDRGDALIQLDGYLRGPFD